MVVLQPELNAKAMRFHSQEIAQFKKESQVVQIKSVNFPNLGASGRDMDDEAGLPQFIKRFI